MEYQESIIHEFTSAVSDTLAIEGIFYGDRIGFPVARPAKFITQIGTSPVGRDEIRTFICEIIPLDQTISQSPDKFFIEENKQYVLNQVGRYRYRITVNPDSYFYASRNLANGQVSGALMIATSDKPFLDMEKRHVIPTHRYGVTTGATGTANPVNAPWWSSEMRYFFNGEGVALIQLRNLDATNGVVTTLARLTNYGEYVERVNCGVSYIDASGVTSGKVEVTASVGG